MKTYTKLQALKLRASCVPGSVAIGEEPCWTGGLLPAEEESCPH